MNNATIESRFEDHKVAPAIIRPGSGTYRDAVSEGTKTVIFGTSMTKNIDYNDFNENYNKGTARFQRWPGGKARHFKYYVAPHLAEERPDTVIIQAGGNDLPTKKSSPTPVLDIANHIIDAAVVCRKYDVRNIFISSVMPRNLPYMQHRRRDLNMLLKNLCTINNFIFIDNSNILLKEHISNDGVHLNHSGTVILANNLLQYLND